MVEVTTQGLVDQATAAESLAPVQWATAGGAADAITAAYTPANTTLTDGLVLGFRSAYANATATPTFAPDGLTAHAITKEGGTALLAGDIPGANFEALVRYNLANTRWELLNPRQRPANWVASGGTADAITATYSPAILALTDGLTLSFRATGANTITNPTFAPNGLTARTITTRGGSALVPGSIPAANAEMQVRYNLANTRWELMNPITGIANDLFKAITATAAGTNVNTAQGWFPSAPGVSVLAGATYVFEGYLYLSRAAGSTSHTTSLLFGGTATITALNYMIEASTGDAAALVSSNTFVGTSASAVVSKSASTSTTEQAWFRVKGVVTINAAGTFIPQFQYSAAPGGVPTAQIGTYFRMTLINSNPQGTWA